MVKDCFDGYSFKAVNLVLIVVVAILLLIPATAFGAEYDAYADGTIGGTYRDYFAGIMADKRYDYVAFRAGQYRYVLAYGELSSSGSVVSGDATIVSIDVASGFGGSATISSGEDDSFSVDVGNSIVYSNVLDNQPVLNEGVKSYEVLALVVALAVLFVFILMHDIYYWWRFCKS